MELKGKVINTSFGDDEWDSIIVIREGQIRKVVLDLRSLGGVITTPTFSHAFECFLNRG